MEPLQIVLVEDNPADVLLVKLALKENGLQHELIEFGTGSDAVDALCGARLPNSQAPDAILFDLNTPCTNGFDALSKLRDRFEHTPITVMTSSHVSADKKKAAAMGVGYLEKQPELHQFLNQVGSEVRRMVGALA